MSYDPITHKLEGAEAAYEEKRRAFVEECETSVAYATSWKLNAVLEAEAIVAIARGYGTDRAAQDQFAREFEERTLPHVRGESRSTSQATNLTEDVAFATKARFYGEIREWRRAEARQAELEAERLEDIRRVGAVVRHTDSPDDRANACLVSHRNENGTVSLVAAGPENIGIDYIDSASPGDLRLTDQEPYVKVREAWEDARDEDQLEATPSVAISGGRESCL